MAQERNERYAQSKQAKADSNADVERQRFAAHFVRAEGSEENVKFQCAEDGVELTIQAEGQEPFAPANEACKQAAASNLESSSQVVLPQAKRRKMVEEDDSGNLQVEAMSSSTLYGGSGGSLMVEAAASPQLAEETIDLLKELICLLYTSPSPRD